MKKYRALAIAAFVMVAVVAMYMTAQAGDYHTGAGLVCSDCHTMHYSVDGGVPPGGAGGPNDKLLLQAGTNDLCLTCHNGVSGVADGAPDVMTTAGVQQALYRAAGAFRATPTNASVSAHNLGVAADVGTNPPGNVTWTVPAGGLDCADCHEPHGTGNYRNLVLRPGGVGADIAVTDITQTVLTPTEDQYKVANIKYGADANGNPDMSNWCSGCHTKFNVSTANQAGGAWTNDAEMGGDDAGDAGGANEAWHRHPVTHVTMNEGNTNTHVSYAWFNTGVSSRTPVASNSATVPANDNVPFCGTCHKAHGSDIDKDTNTGEAPNNLIYDDGSTIGIQDGTNMQSTCNICHKKS